jgi:hypothetical protein
MTEHKYLTTAELAKLWRRVDSGTISNYAADGRLPGAFKVGNEWLIPAEGLTLLPRPAKARPKRSYVRKSKEGESTRALAPTLRQTSRSRQHEPAVDSQILEMRRRVDAALMDAAARRKRR